MSHSKTFLHDPGLRVAMASEWGLDRATVDKLLAAAVPRHFARGASISAQGTHRSNVFVVLHGTVSISIVLPGGEQILCAFYRPGAMFGFPMPEGERPRISAADAFTPATVAAIPRRDFEHVIAALPPATLIRFFNKLLERQARFATRLAHCVVLDLRGRLALTLIDLATTFGEAHGGHIRVRLPLTHANLAEMVGASRERVSRAMAALMRDGVLRYTRQAITVVDLTALREVATPAG